MNELIMLLRLVPLVWSQVTTFLHVGRIILLIPPLVLLLATILVMSGTNCVTLEQRWSLLPNTGTGVSALLFIGFSCGSHATLHCMFLFLSLFSRQPQSKFRCALRVPWLAHIRAILQH